MTKNNEQDNHDQCFSTDVCQLEKKWRSDFVVEFGMEPSRMVSGGDIRNDIWNEKLLAYLASRKKAQVEIKELEVQLCYAQTVGIGYGKTIDRISGEMRLEKTKLENAAQIIVTKDDEIQKLKEQLIETEKSREGMKAFCYDLQLYIHAELIPIGRYYSFQQIRKNAFTHAGCPTTWGDETYFQKDFLKLNNIDDELSRLREKLSWAQGQLMTAGKDVAVLREQLEEKEVNNDKNMSKFEYWWKFKFVSEYKTFDAEKKYSFTPSEIREAYFARDEEIEKINSEYALCLKTFCEKNDAIIHSFQIQLKEKDAIIKDFQRANSELFVGLHNTTVELVELKKTSGIGTAVVMVASGIESGNRMIKVSKISSVGNSCNFCRVDERGRSDYPHVFELSATGLNVRFCPACFEEAKLLIGKMK